MCSFYLMASWIFVPHAPSNIQDIVYFATELNERFISSSARRIENNTFPRVGMEPTTVYSQSRGTTTASNKISLYF